VTISGGVGMDMVGIRIGLPVTDMDL
jgi:hypothetical protein